MSIIDSYQFGLIVINGERYTSDLIIFPDRVRDNWRRRQGHIVSLEDIAEAMVESPEVLVVGTGAEGLVRVLPEVETDLETRGIRLITEPTNEACNMYNQLCRSQRVVAALHITC